MTPSTGDPEKMRLRASLREARSALGGAERQHQSAALRREIVRHLGARQPADHGAGRPVVAAYLGREPEPDTTALLTELHRSGFDVVVPICEPEYRLSWTFWHPGVALQRSVRGPVDEPIGPRYPFDGIGRVILILVPALGVDGAGTRIGQGGGYYDRFLAQFPPDAPGAVPRLAVIYRAELLAASAIPSEDHDQRVGGAFTPDGLVYFGGG